MDEHLLRFNKTKTYTFIDFETFNLCLNFCHNLPWQVGMLKVKGESILDSKNFYLKWDTELKISEDAARITRFDPLKVSKLGVYQSEVFPTIKDWLENCDFIVGHNILGFDIFLIKELYKINGLCYKHLVEKIIDTNCLAKGIKMSIPYKQKDNLLEYQYKLLHTVKRGIKTRLELLGGEYEIDHDYANLHDAITDLELNLKVWNKLKWAIEI